MQDIKELEGLEKELKKELREAGGLVEVFPEMKQVYEEQIKLFKELQKQIQTAEQTKVGLFGKGSKQKKEAEAAIEEAEKRMEELSEKIREYREMLTPVPTISVERKKELSELATAGRLKEIEALEYEELAYCLVATLGILEQIQKAEKKDEISQKRFSDQVQKLQMKVAEGLRSKETVYVAFSPATRCPYLDLREQQNQSCLWVFTKEEYAKNCKFHFAKEYIFMDVVEVKKEALQEFAKNLPRWGFNFLILNNGVHNLMLKLEAWIGTVNYSCPINPKLYTRRFDFFQALLSFNKVPQTNHTLYEKYHNPMLIKAKESVMLYEMSQAQYSVVMKTVVQKDATGKEVEMTEIPTSIKDEQRFLLIFTDMLEFTIWQKVSGFQPEAGKTIAKTLNFDGICTLAKETGADFVLDAAGWQLQINETHRNAVNQVAQQIAELKKKEEKKS